MANIDLRSGGSRTLQETYDQSTPPKILIDTIRKALIFGASASNLNNLLEFQNMSGTVEAYIRGDGRAKFSSIVYTPADASDWSTTCTTVPSDVFDALDNLADWIANCGASLALTVQDEGVDLDTAVNQLNFIGAGVTAVENADHEIDITIPGTIGSILTVQDEGIDLDTAVTKLNFIGDNVTAVENADHEIDITITGSSQLTVQDEGIDLDTAVTKLNFIGAGVTAVENADHEIDITISGAAAGTVTDSLLRWNGSAWIEETDALLTSTGRFRVSDGTVVLPSFSFVNDTDTGFYRVGANQVGFTAGGVDVIDFSALAVTLQGGARLLVTDGLVTAPGIGFANDTNTGFYRVGASEIGVTTGGSLRGTWSNTSLSLDSSIILNVNNTTDSGDILTGALVVSGGAGFAKAVNVGTTLTIGSPGGPADGYGYGDSTGSLVLYGDLYVDDDAIFAEDIILSNLASGTATAFLGVDSSGRIINSGISVEALLADQIDLNTSDSEYTIADSSITANSTPVCTVVGPASSSTIFVTQIYDIQNGSFKVKLSGTPPVVGYKLNWISNGNVLSGGGGGGGSALTVQDEGINLDTAVTKLNFIGAGVTAVENADHEIDITITGGGAATLQDAYDGGGTITLNGADDFLIKGAINNYFAVSADTGDITIGVPGGPADGYGYGDSTGSLILYGDLYVDDDATFAENVTINGKLTVNGLIDPTGLVLDEQSSVPSIATTGKATLWVDSSSKALKFTDDTGVDRVVSSLASSGVILDEDFTGASVSGATIGGDASFDAANNWVQLTPNTTSQYGYVYWDEDTTVNFTAEIEFYITANTGADATVFFWGCNSDTTSSISSSGWAVEFDEFNNTVELGYDNSIVSTKTSTQPINGWNTATISQVRDRITVNLNGTTVITYSGAEQNPFVGNIVGVSARTGGSTNEHRVRLVKITGFSVAAVGQIYSEKEQITDNYWIDGKPIYRKVISLGVLPNSSTKNVAHGITGIDYIVSIRGTSYKSSTSTFLPLPFADPTSDTALYVSGSNVVIATESDRTDHTEAYAILEYTKT